MSTAHASGSKSKAAARRCCSCTAASATSRLWEPQARALAAHFRCIRYDLRFWGRSESPGVEFSSVDDAIGVLDALGVDRAAIVGLSIGGGLALDVTLAHPDRVWALVHVAAGVTGHPGRSVQRRAGRPRTRRRRSAATSTR